VSYTAAALLGCLFAVLLDLVVLRTGLVRRRVFWASYLVVLAFQVVVDGVLTGQRLVVYAPDAINGARFVYAPIEDLFFGFSLVLQTLAWWVWWGRRQPSNGNRVAASPSEPATSGGTSARPPAASA
jgi:lycopene cyclase domain-containing protein